MGDVEAVGDVLTGAILGRAVEPHAGESSEGHSHETQCLNCGAPLTGPYCHQCGQHAHVHRTLTAFFHDLAHGVFHLEGKLWNTIPMLAWRPGELTRRYIDGQRARFVSPIALFLFSVFLMFAIMGMTGVTKQSNFGSAGLTKAQAESASNIADLQRQRAALIARGQATTKIDQKIADEQQGLATLQSLAKTGLPPGVTRPKPHIDSDVPWLSTLVKKTSANPELVFYELKTNAYKFSWALIPISVPFVWLLFPFSRRFRLYDHTVFVTYSLCFMMLLLSVATLIELVSTSIASLAWFVPPIHMYRQLRGTYDIGKGSAVWRTFALTIFAFIAISLFGSMLIAIGEFE